MDANLRIVSFEVHANSSSTTDRDQREVRRVRDAEFQRQIGIVRRQLRLAMQPVCELNLGRLSTQKASYQLAQCRAAGHESSSRFLKLETVRASHFVI